MPEVDAMGNLQFKDSATDDIAETAYADGTNWTRDGSESVNTYMERGNFWNDDERDGTKSNGKRPAGKVKKRSRGIIGTHITKVVIAMLERVTHPELRP